MINFGQKWDINLLYVSNLSRSSNAFGCHHQIIICLDRRNQPNDKMTSLSPSTTLAKNQTLTFYIGETGSFSFFYVYPYFTYSSKKPQRLYLCKLT